MPEIPRHVPDMSEPSQEMINLELSMQNQEDTDAAVTDAMEYVSRTVQQMEEEREISPEMAVVYQKIGVGEKGKLSVQEQFAKTLLGRMKSFAEGSKDMSAIRAELKTLLRERLKKMSEFAESKRQLEKGRGKKKEL